MSTSSCPLAIVAALQKFDDLLGPERVWEGLNDCQRSFLDEFFGPYRKGATSIPEIESIAATTAAPINKFLADRGFTIQLSDFSSDELGTASVLDLLMEWHEAGRETSITGHDGKTYPAVGLAEGIVTFFRSPSHPHVVASVAAKQQSDAVSVTILDEPVEGFDLVRLVRDRFVARERCYDFAGLHMPMVDYRQEIDIKFLCGTQTHNSAGQLYFISQALQENRLRLDEHGARAQSAVALAAKRGMSVAKPPLVINRPFLIWFTRQGIELPLFVGYITPEDWKQPESTLQR